MLKKTSYIFLFLMIVILTSCFFNRPLIGKILFTNNEDAVQGLVSFDSKNKELILLKGEFDGAEVNNLKETVLIKLWNKSSKFRFLEFDIKKKTTRYLLKSTNQNSGDITNMRYVPGGNMISYIHDRILYIFTPSSNHINEVGTAEHYTWSRDGKYFLYNAPLSSMIFKYNIQTKKENLLINGSQPEYSNNNNYVAYMSAPKDLLSVREINTGKTWVYLSNDPVWNYRFSADDESVFLIKHDNKSLDHSSSTLIAWNFKKNVENNLIADYPGAYEFSCK